RWRLYESKKTDGKRNSGKKYENSKGKNENVKHERPNCPYCDGGHPIFFCDKFKAMKVIERKNVVKEKALCLLCLRPKHTVAECTYKKMCPTCGKKHNGLLHFGDFADNKKNDNSKPFKKSFVAVATEEVDEMEQIVACLATSEETSVTKPIDIYLATAMIRIKTKYGWSEPLRALIDQGSMGSFCSEDVVNRFKLIRRKNSVQITGIGETTTERSKGSVDIELTSRYPTSFRSKTTAVILNKLMSAIPIKDGESDMLKGTELENLILADPNFWKKSKIDFILGADVFARLILHGVIKSHPAGLVAQETEVGWIISGPRYSIQSPQIVCMVSEIDELDESLKKFWDMEEIGNEKTLSSEDEYCQEYFAKTVERDLDGRYIVALPFKEPRLKLG
ncbi:MAG: hypothetical protein EOP45_19885, partial [Sphingobacteriaceae bacterium]